jgi:hypothetical protein
VKYHADINGQREKCLFALAERNERGQMIADFSWDFPRYLTKIGIKGGRGLSLYSFRYGAADALRRAGYLDEQFGFILGHTAGTMTGNARTTREVGRFDILPRVGGGALKASKWGR